MADKSKVWKFVFIKEAEMYKAQCQMPRGAKIIHFGYDGMGRLCAWAQFVTLHEKTLETHTFVVVPTGVEIEVSGDHLATVSFDTWLGREFHHIFRGPIYSEGES